MNYPLISEYVEAIRSAEENFATLTNLRPVLDEDGNPVMTSGNFAVVFKMKGEENGKFYAVKCFLKDQPNRAESYKMIADELEYVSSTFLVQFRYLDKELFVDTNSSDEQEFPVLVMDWVDGVTLDKYIRQNINDQYALQMLAYQFSKLAMWIIPQPFAHGDIKPDNIMVRNDGLLVLIDYDGMYVPAMKGQKARELGSPDFRHPSRTEDDFDEHIDDFSLVSILLSLRAIANDSSLLERYGAADRLLFSEKDYRNISYCQLLKELYPSTDNEINTLVSLFTIALTQGDLSKISFRLLTLNRPEELEIMSTEVTEEDLASAWVDEFGAKYSTDKKRLLHISKYIEKYKIKKGTIVISDDAFNNTLIHNGYCVSYLNQIQIPNSVTTIGNNAFSFCLSLQQITIPNSVTTIGEGAFNDCHSLQCITLPNNLTCIQSSTFSLCSSLLTISLPSSVKFIGDYAFEQCSSLKHIYIPSNVKKVGNYAFAGCTELQKVTISDGVESIGECAFGTYTFTVENGRDEDKIYTFTETVEGCIALTSIIIPNSVKSLGNGGFSGCVSLKSIVLSNSITEIGDNVFKDCKSLLNISIPINVTTIGNRAFDGCESLQKITITENVASIGDYAFFNCKSLQQIIIPESVTSIGNFTFSKCSSLQNISIPDSVTDIGVNIFKDCASLQQILITNKTYNRLKDKLQGYSEKIVFTD